MIVEVKSGVEDFRADGKWGGYLEWADRFYFAVDEAFPTALLPQEVGALRADGYEAAELWPAPLSKLAPARRKAVTLRAARKAAERLRRLEDPSGL